MKFFLSLLFMAATCLAEGSCPDGQTWIYRMTNEQSSPERRCEDVPSKNLPTAGKVLLCAGSGFRKCKSKTQEDIDSLIPNEPISVDVSQACIADPALARSVSKLNQNLELILQIWSNAVPVVIVSVIAVSVLIVGYKIYKILEPGWLRQREMI